MHTGAEAPFNGHDLDDRALTRGECRRSQLHGVLRQLTIESEPLEGHEVHLALIHRPHHVYHVIASGQRSTCLQGTGSTESVPHTVTHSPT